MPGQRRRRGTGRAEISPGIATVLLILVALAGGLVVHYVSQQLDTPLHEERVPPSAVLIEHAYFVKVGNLTNLVLNIRGLMGSGVLDTVYLYDKEGVLAAVGTLLTPQETRVGEVHKLVYALEQAPEEGVYRVILGQGSGRNSAGGGTVPIAYRPSVTFNIYLINVTGVPNHFISNPLLLKNALEKIGNTQIVNTTSDLQALVSNAGPTTIVINLHGEALPTPTAYWSSAGYQNTTYPNGTSINWGLWEWKGPTPDWRTWLTQIRTAMVSRGAIWIEAGGWAFYYLANESSTQTWGSTTGTLGWYKVAQCDYGDCTMAGSGQGLGLHYILTGQEAYVTQTNTSAYCYSPNPLTLEATPDLQALSSTVQQIIGTPPPTTYTTTPSLDRPCLINATQVNPTQIIALHQEPGGNGYLGAYIVKLGQGLLGHVGYGTPLPEQQRAALIVALVLKAVAEKQ